MLLAEAQHWIVPGALAIMYNLKKKKKKRDDEGRSHLLSSNYNMRVLHSPNDGVLTITLALSCVLKTAYCFLQWNWEHLHAKGSGPLITWKILQIFCIKNIHWDCNDLQNHFYTAPFRSDSIHKGQLISQSHITELNSLLVVLIFHLFTDQWVC